MTTPSSLPADSVADSIAAAYGGIVLDKSRLEQGIARRYRAERRFRLYGKIAIGLAMLMLLLLLISIVSRGYLGFFQTQIRFDIPLEESVLDPSGQRDPLVLRGANYAGLLRESLKETFPDVKGRLPQRELSQLLSSIAPLQLREKVLANPNLIGSKITLWVTASDTVDMFHKGYIDGSLPQYQRTIRDSQIAWLKSLKEQERLKLAFNPFFFTAGDSREPEQAGFWGSMVGSVLTVLVCMLLALPVGVMAAVYLEEFARKNWFTDLIEININNLAAVPSIIFGLLGLSVYLNTMELPRSAPLVGGMTLALLILPVIVISTRIALRAVPGSIRDAARGLGASPVQIVAHHVLPLSMPGIMTGTILSMARAIGETAPLLMVGMVAFISDVPRHFTDPATVMPVQVYLWAGSPEMGFVEKTSSGIMVLITVMLLMNLGAIFLRKKFEVRW